MKKAALSFLSLCLAAQVHVMAQSAPDLEFSAGGDSASIQLNQDGAGNWDISPGTQVSLANGVTFTLNSITVESDPYVFYSYSVQNTGTTTMFYQASIPSVPATLPTGTYSVTASLGISLTNANPGGGVSISPASGTVQQGLIGGNDAGVDLDSTTVTNSTFGSTSTTNFSAGESDYFLATPSGSITVTESFDLSPGASVGISGFFNVQTVPEPSGVALGLIALGAFVALVRTRRQNV